MTNSKYTYIALGVAALLIAGAFGASYYLKKDSTQNPTGTIENIDGIPEGATVEIVDRVNADLFDKTPRPSLDRVLPQGSLPADAYAILSGKRAEAVALINANPASMNTWLGLGILHKQVNDYEGAKIYWTYVATVNPENLAAHLNLASLYASYLKDVVAAEREYRKVIALDPTYVEAYTSLAALLVEKNNTNEAAKVLDGGIIKNPASTDLLVARAKLYITAGDKDQARALYDKAIKAAETAKETDLAALLKVERAAI